MRLRSQGLRTDPGADTGTYFPRFPEVGLPLRQLNSEPIRISTFV